MITTLVFPVAEYVELTLYNFTFISGNIPVEDSDDSNIISYYAEKEAQ